MRNFYAKAVTELKDCFNFDNEVYGLLFMILKPKNARQLSPKSLSSFFCDTLYCAITSMKVMLRVSGERTSIFFIIISMFRGILNTRDSEFYLNRVFAFKSPSGEPQFPNLKVFFFLCHSVMHPPKDFSATSKTQNLRKKYGLHDKSVDALIKGKNWLKNLGAKRLVLLLFPITCSNF